MRPRPAPAEARGCEFPPRTVLRGRQLFVARLAWLGLALLSTIIFFASVPVAYAQLHAPCRGVECYLSASWLTPEAARPLAEMGLSLDSYAAYKVVIGTAWTFGCWVIGAILF
jgi:hypothetical protein